MISQVSGNCERFDPKRLAQGGQREEEKTDIPIESDPRAVISQRD
jgi:hypothetical protein